MTATAQPLVSVILSCYNSERYLSQTLASVRGQTYQNWELIAVDDLSSDSTAKILEEAAKEDPRIKPVYRRDRGGRPAVTKNTGLQHAQGDFIAFIDHDDLYLPEKLEISVKGLLELTDCVALFHDLEYIDAAGVPSVRYLPHLLRDAYPHLTAVRHQLFQSDERFWVFQMLRYAGFHTITAMIARHRLPLGAIHFDTNYAVCDDTDMWIRLGAAGRVAYVDRVIAQYRIHGSNITSNTTKVHRDSAKIIAYNLQERSAELTPAERELLTLRLVNCYTDLAWSLRQSSEHLAAAAACWHAFRLSPRLPILITLLKSFVRPRTA